MNIFVTVGTTKFDSLIGAVDKVAKNDGNTYIYQIANGEYKPLFGNYFTFTKCIDKYYSQADVVITHAGAGSIYTLLERRKKIIIVPNLDRVDKHQSDISEFMEKGQYAKVCNDLDSIEQLIKGIGSFNPNQFLKIDFFKEKEIASFLLS